MIVVTGTSEDIGRALRLALAPQRPRLIIAARNEGCLHERMKELESKGARALVIPADVTGKVGRWIRLVSPRLSDRIARKAIREQKQGDGQ